MKSIEDGEIQETFDLHVPKSHAYIANGIVVHNTFEDVEYCLKVRELGYNIRIAQTAIGYHWVSATAMKHGLGYPLSQNQNIFMSRMNERLIYDEWRYL